MHYEKCSPTAIPAVREHFAYFLYELIGCLIILIIDGMHLRHQFVFLQSSACTECFQGIIVIPELSIYITQQNHWIFGYHLVSVLYRNNEFPILNIQHQNITCMNISRHLVHYVEESPDEILGKIACPTRINCVLYKNYPAARLVDYAERFLPYGIPIQFRYDYTETTPENLYEEEHDKILQDLKKQFTYKGLDGCRMRNGYHFDYKGLHMTYHKTLPYSTIVETGDDGVTYDILYDILIKQNGDIHSDWTGVKLDVDAYRKVVFEPYDLRVLEGTVDF